MIIGGGSDMLSPFSLCLRRCPPASLLQAGRYIVDNGAGHAFALVTTATSITSFEEEAPRFFFFCEEEAPRFFLFCDRALPGRALAV
jgi:hypothetical protein